MTHTIRNTLNDLDARLLRVKNNVETMTLTLLRRVTFHSCPSSRLWKCERVILACG